MSRPGVLWSARVPHKGSFPQGPPCTHIPNVLSLQDWESSRRKRAGKGSPSPRARKRKSPEAAPPPPPGRSRFAGAALADGGSPAGTAAAPRRPPGAPQLVPKRLFVGEQRWPLSLLASPPAVRPVTAAEQDLGANIMDLGGLAAGVAPSERSNGGAQTQPPAAPGSSTPAVQSERQLSLLRSGGAPQRHRRKPAAPAPAMAEMGAAPPWQVFMGSLHEPAQQAGARSMHSGQQTSSGSSGELARRQLAGARGGSAMDADVSGVQGALTEEELDLAVALLLGTECGEPAQGPHPTVPPEARQPVQRRSPSSWGGGAGAAFAAADGQLASAAAAAGEMEISNGGAAAEPAAAAEAWVAPQQAAPQLGSPAADSLDCLGTAQDVLQGVGYSGPLDMCTDAARAPADGAVPLALRTLSPSPVAGVLQPAAQDSGSSTRKRSSSGGGVNSSDGSSIGAASSPRRRRGSINPLAWGNSSGSSSQACLEAAEEGEEEEEGPALRLPANVGMFGIEVGCKLMAVDRAALHLRQRGLAGCGRGSPPSADRAAVVLAGLSLRQRRSATLGRPLELSYAPGSGRTAAVVAVGR